MAQRPKQLGALKSTRAAIVDLLRRRPLTAREIAAQLGMTYHAVRLHLLALARDGVVHVSGSRGATRPASVYETRSEVDAALSQAYVPFAAHLTEVLGERLAPRQVSGIMRTVGRRMAASWPRPRGPLLERVRAAAALLQDLGSPNEVEQKGAVVRIRSARCLLAQAVRGRAEVCLAMEALLAELLDAKVQQRCKRGERPRCCFEVTRAV